MHALISTEGTGSPSDLSPCETMTDSRSTRTDAYSGAKMSALHFRCAGKLEWQAIAVAAQSQSVAKERGKGWLIKRL